MGVRVTMGRGWKPRACTGGGEERTEVGIEMTRESQREPGEHGFIEAKGIRV